MPPSPPGEATVVITPAALRAWPLPLPPQGDKHTRGTVLVIGGSPGTPGAVLLAGLAALRAGAGRLQLASSVETARGLAIAVPESLVVGLDGVGTVINVPSAMKALEERLATASAVLVGPGLVPGAWVGELVQGVVERSGEDTIVVLDAAAITCLAEADPGCLSRVRGRLVATPNRDEAAMLVPGLADDVEPIRQAEMMANYVGGVATVYGDVAAADGRRWSTGTGAIGLGTSGSGDVLAGIVAGLAARCADPAQAACWGTYLHGTAGDRLAASIGPVGYLARELLGEIPPLLAELSR